MKRKDLEQHTKHCYLRPYQCEFCGHKDTYEAISGISPFRLHRHPGYGGHQAECPEVPLSCPNHCGSDKIKRKDMESHRSQCPQEPVECPFAEAGCKKKPQRCQLNTHVTSNVQEHVSLMMKDYRETKRELLEVKGTLATAVQLLRQGTKADKETVDFVIACSVRLEKYNDLVKVVMPKFSEYRRSGKVWHSPPFYYREGYKMCLAVHANGVGDGAGTHVSVTLTLLKGEHDNGQHHHIHSYTILGILSEGRKVFNVCGFQPLGQYSGAVTKLSCEEKFCTHKYIVSKLVNDCFTFNIAYSSDCDLLVSVK